MCGKLISRFLEVNEIRAKITHSLEDELKVAELFGGNWFWQWNWQKTCLTHLGSDPICDGLARSSKTLCQTGSKGPHSWSPNSTDFSINHRLWLSICLTNIRGEMQGNQLGTTHWPGSLIGRHQDNYKTSKTKEFSPMDTDNVPAEWRKATSIGANFTESESALAPAQIWLPLHKLVSEVKCAPHSYMGVEYGSYCSLYGEATWTRWCYMVWKMVGASITGYRVVYEQKHGWKWCKRGKGRVWRLSNAHIYGILVSITLHLLL